MTPMHQSELASVIPDRVPSPAPCQPVPPPPESDWLDELALGLSECGWLALDATPHIGSDLLRGLQREVIALDQQDALRFAGIGRGSSHVRDRSVRRDRIAWLNGDSAPQQALCAFFESIQAGLNRRLFLGLRRFEAHYAIYHPGDYYRQHLDSFRGRASRVVSLVLYLNDDWQAGEGGALQVCNPDNDPEVVGTVLPDMGTMAVFMSEEVPHEVVAATRTRLSIACWFRQD